MKMLSFLSEGRYSPKSLSKANFTEERYFFSSSHDPKTKEALSATLAFDSEDGVRRYHLTMTAAEMDLIVRYWTNAKAKGE